MITKKAASAALKPSVASISSQVRSSHDVVEDKLSRVTLTQHNIQTDVNVLKDVVSSFSEKFADLKSAVAELSHNVRNLHDAQSQRYTWLKSAIPHLSSASRFDEVVSMLKDISDRDFSDVLSKLDVISSNLSSNVTVHDCLSAEISSLHDSVSEILMQPTATSSSIAEIRRLVDDHNVLIQSSLNHVLSDTAHIFGILRSARDHALAPNSDVEIDVEDEVSDSDSSQVNSPARQYRPDCQGVDSHVHVRQRTDWSEVVVIDDDLRSSDEVRDLFISGGVQCSDIDRKPNSRYVHALVHPSSVERLLADGLLTEHNRLVVEMPRGCRFKTQG